MDHGGSWCIGATVCHLQCEISSVKVTGLRCPGGGSGGEIFLRCQVPAGGGRTIQIDSHAGAGAEAEPRGAASWRDVASMRCDGSPACVRELVDRRSVVFEVRRRRRRRRILGSSSSELVGSAEVAWRDVVVGDDEAAVAVERRVELADADAATAPAVMWVRMSVRVSETTAAAVSAPGRRAHRAARRRESANAAEWEWSAGGVDDVFAMAACVADDAFE